MTGTVTITPTTLDAAAAFRVYGDHRTKGSEISSLSVLPGDLCGYSGQELMGMLADQPGQGSNSPTGWCVWTNDGNFLIAIRLQAPWAPRWMPRSRCCWPTSASACPANLADMLTELIALPGGDFRMGSADFYPDEGAGVSPRRWLRSRSNATP